MVYIALILIFSVIILSLYVLPASLTLNYIEQIYFLLLLVVIFTLILIEQIYF